MPDPLDTILPVFLARVGAPRIASLTALHDRPRSAIRRLQFEKSWHGHERLIAKQVVGNGAAQRFDRELAAYRLLASCHVDPPVAPALLAWDFSSHIFLFEDLGDQGLAGALTGRSRSAAHAALLNYAATLGRMHASTAGVRLRDIGGNIPDNLRDIYRDSAHFQQFCQAADMRIDAGFALEIGQTAAVLDVPGPFHAFTHGDPCPDNERLLAHSVVFIDFETGGFDHALLDAAYFTMAFPTCWCVGALPPEVLVGMQTIYRQALAIHVPEADDDVLFHRHLLHASARWLIDGNTLVPRIQRTGENHLSKLLEADWSWGPATARQRLLHRLQVFVQLAENANALHSIASTAERLHRHLASRWPEHDQTLAPYPAFTKD